MCNAKKCAVKCANCKCGKKPPPIVKIEDDGYAGWGDASTADTSDSIYVDTSDDSSDED